MTTKSTRRSPNAGMTMSAAARTRMRTGEKVVLHYYNDMGPNRGNCTWGVGILAHYGVCNDDELERKVSMAELNKEFERRVAEAEGYVKRGITKVSLNQEQFDGLISLTYNAGIRNVRGTYGYINDADFDGAAANISKMTKVSIKKNGKRIMVTAPGLIKRRAEESAPFRTAARQSKDAK
jgi:lysozyme